MQNNVPNPERRTSRQIRLLVKAAWRAEIAERRSRLLDLNAAIAGGKVLSERLNHLTRLERKADA